MKSIRKHKILLYFCMITFVPAIIEIIILYSLYNPRIYLRERNAGILKTISQYEEIFKEQDLDENHIEDFWVGDLLRFAEIVERGQGSFYYHLKRKAPLNKKKGEKYPCYKYFYQAMKYDQDGNLYNQGNFRNTKHFGYIAIPANERNDVLIINEDNKVYYKNVKNSYDANGNIIENLLRWPGNKPEDYGWKLYKGKQR